MTDVNFILRAGTALTSRGQDRIALSLEDKPGWTWTELDARASRVAADLLGAGVVAGDRVGLMMQNSLDYAALYFGIVRIGAICVRLNWRLTAEEIEFAIGDSGCSLLSCDEFSAATLGSVDESVRPPVYLYGNPAETPAWAQSADTEPRLDHRPEFVRPQPTDPAFIMYTSGTTGRPKGAIWTHANVLGAAVMQSLQWRYGPDTVAMTTGPMYHVGGWEDLLMPALMCGGRAVVSNSSGFDLARTLRVAAKEQVTDLFLFPAMVAEVPARVAEDEFDLSRLRRVVCGGTTITPRVVREFHQAIPHVTLAQGYGLTEGGALACVLSDADAETHTDTVGRPFPLVEVKVVDHDGHECAPGVDGEVCVRGPAVSPGYWNRTEANAETFFDGWCRTGDQGQVTHEGFVKITGRFKDMVRTGGENVYPAEVEAVLAEHPSIADIAIIGVPDPRFDEAVCAVVVRNGPLETEELIEYSRTRLAGYKRPQHVHFVDELPRNLSGKVLKYLLRERYS